MLTGLVSFCNVCRNDSRTIWAYPFDWSLPAETDFHSPDVLAQPTSTLDPPLRLVPTRPGGFLLRAVLALNLIYYAGLMLDLALHPWATSVGDWNMSHDVSAANRISLALTGTGIILLGVFVSRRVPGNPIGLLLICYGVGTAGWSARQVWGSLPLTTLVHFIVVFYFVGVWLPMVAALLLYFPSGHIYPRRAKAWLIVYAVLTEIDILLSVASLRPGENFLGYIFPLNPLFVPALAPYSSWFSGNFGLFSALVGGILVPLVTLVWRYRAADSRERQQMKWFVWVAGLFGVVIIGFILQPADNVVFGSAQLGMALFIFYSWSANVWLAIGIALALLLSRLWDIDLIIRRTLVYSVLTALLALVYFGSVLGLQALFTTLTGAARSELVTVLSTLVIAALFVPLRQRLQAAIDRRFYRRKYDAARILAQFSTSLRDEVDLNYLAERLMSVVQDTMQPESVGLWLKPGLGQPLGERIRHISAKR
jgi:hypothetical protein